MCKVFKSNGFSLTEMTATIAIIAIGAIGGLDYQYQSMKQSRIAQTQLTATNSAQMLIEDWKSTGGSTAYNPANLQMGYAAGGVPAGFAMGRPIGNVLNSNAYSVTINNVPMVIVLGYTDVETDAVSGTILRQLNAMVRWRQGQAIGSGGTTLCDTPVILSTYVRLDD